MNEKWITFQSKMSAQTLYLLRYECKKHNEKMEVFLEKFVKEGLKKLGENKNDCTWKK